MLGENVPARACDPLPDIPETSPPRTPSEDALLSRTLAELRRIQARGGEVVLLHLPADGANRVEELQRYPRAVFWDALAAECGCVALYSDDNPEVAPLRTLDDSHLDGPDAERFTEALARWYLASRG